MSKELHLVTNINEIDYHLYFFVCQYVMLFFGFVFNGEVNNVDTALCLTIGTWLGGEVIRKMRANTYPEFRLLNLLY